MSDVAALAANAGLARRQARLAAVQALYQMDLAHTDVTDVVDEFRTHRMGIEAEAAETAEADADHFERLVRAAVSRQEEFDPLINQQLASGWRLARIDAIVRATLRAAVTELMSRSDIPARVVISEYVEVAKAFFEGDEPKVVNAVVDKLARRLRPKEFDQAPAVQTKRS